MRVINTIDQLVYLVQSFKPIGCTIHTKSQ